MVIGQARQHGRWNGMHELDNFVIITSNIDSMRTQDEEVFSITSQEEVFRFSSDDRHFSRRSCWNARRRIEERCTSCISNSNKSQSFQLEELLATRQ